jgi:hypothetical protein
MAGVLYARSLRIVAAALLVFALHGCSAMMMTGGGGYKAPAETCSSEQEAAGHCKKI